MKNGPEVGDTPAVLEQKAQNRKIAISAMQAAAGQDPDAEKKLNELAEQIKSGETKKAEQESPQRAFIGNRAIIVKNNKWVYEDTGEPVE